MYCEFEGYQILETLGEGTFGKVKLAKKDDKYFAIKFSSKSKAYSFQILNRIFLKQSNIVSQLNHPNIVKLNDSFLQGSYFRKGAKKQLRSALVFEYMPHSLGQVLELGNFDQTLSRTIFTMMLNGISYLHSQNIIHRDLKPANLLFDQHFNLKICDFGIHVNNIGLSTKIDPQNKPKTICGSDSFKSPQMLLKKTYNGVMNDLFAAGVTLFILVMGRAPFINATPNNGYYQFIAMNYLDKFWKIHQKKKQATPQFKSLINSMLAFDPTHRLTIPQILSHPWMRHDVLMGQQLQNQMLKRKAELQTRKKQILQKLQQQSTNQSLNKYNQQNKRSYKLENQLIIKNPYNSELTKITDRKIAKINNLQELTNIFSKLNGQIIQDGENIYFQKMMEEQDKIIIDIKVQQGDNFDCLKFKIKEGHIINYVEILRELDSILLSE